MHACMYICLYIDNIAKMFLYIFFCLYAGRPLSILHVRQIVLPELYTERLVAELAQCLVGPNAEYAAFIHRVNDLPICDLVAAYRQIFPAPLPFPHPEPQRQVLTDADYRLFSAYVYSFPAGGPAPPPRPSSSSAAPELVLNEYRMQMLAHLWRLEGDLPPPVGDVTLPFLSYLSYVNGYSADLTVLINDYRVHKMVNLTRDPVSATAVDLIHNILRETPEDRFTIAQVRAHPWMTESP